MWETNIIEDSIESLQYKDIEESSSVSQILINLGLFDEKNTVLCILLYTDLNNNFTARMSDYFSSAKIEEIIGYNYDLLRKRNEKFEETENDDAFFVLL
jgi:hypothetical protein